jgi:asparagine synthase (glutamine-hydrolysing)
VRRGGGELETFSATFPGHAVDERAHIDRVVAHVGAHAHFVSPTAEGFLDDFDRFLFSHDEPVGSLSQYAGYAVARLTRAAGVPVTLNGQGGDEVMSGYWECYLVHLRGLAVGGAPFALCRHLGGAALPGGNPELLRQLPIAYRRYRSQRAPGRDLALRGPAEDDFAGPAARVIDMSPAERRVYDVRELSLPRLLKWDDRNFMAFSVEGRYPFLDHELIETCLGFDAGALYRRGWTKEPLRRGLQGLLPDTVLRRRGKVGFETPQEARLRGPLRARFDMLLAGDSPAWTYVEPGEARRQGAERKLRVLVLDRWLRQHFC